MQYILPQRGVPGRGGVKTPGDTYGWTGDAAPPGPLE